MLLRNTLRLSSKLARGNGVQSLRMVQTKVDGLRGEPKYVSDPQLPDNYPNLPRIYAQHKNPWHYQDQQDRRNLEEPINEQDEILSVWAPDQHDYPANKALFELLCVAGFFASAIYVYSFWAPECPAVRRSYPFDGLRVELGNDPNTTTNERRVVRSTNEL